MLILNGLTVCAWDKLVKGHRQVSMSFALEDIQRFVLNQNLSTTLAKDLVRVESQGMGNALVITALDQLLE